MFRHSKKPKTKSNQIVCLCNSVDRQTIEQAICRGCNTLSQIFDATSAGVGPCGGSCRPKLALLLQSYLSKGKFPEKL